MSQSFSINNEMLIESVTFGADDVVIGYSARNRRTRAWTGATMLTYFKSQLQVAAISINTTTNIITLTHGDGEVITGTTTS